MNKHHNLITVGQIQHYMSLEGYIKAGKHEEWRELYGKYPMDMVEFATWCRRGDMPLTIGVCNAKLDKIAGLVAEQQRITAELEALLNG